ncbi:septum site-determining protein Ssd [Rhodococcus sp. MTM3W5.2]|uniref:septum site-determining protein Ssd n=1 Tax=Rhodococcus sp. MTM3W5.2 TaxID=1805827 RepID=UPI00097C5C86|nr:septum site-determining protein Ssd [Rhodococcus sp. MTM3W5.2]
MEPPHASGAPHPPNVRPVLAVLEEDGLSLSVRRAAAAADRALDERVLPIPRQVWDGAATIALDQAAARACAADALPRRSAVHVVCSGPPGLLEWQAAAAVGAESVLVLPADEPALVESLAQRRDRTVAGGSVVAVVGGCGGAGASTLAAAIALTGPARRAGSRALLVDADPQGGGLDLLLGLEDRPGLRWPAVVVEGGRVSAAALHDALPGAGAGVAVLSCGRGGDAGRPSASAMRAMVESGCSAGDLVVCDVGRGLGDLAGAVFDLADLVAVVVPAQVRSAAAAESVVAAARTRNPNVGVVVRGPAPGGLRGTDVGELLGLPVLAVMRPQPRLSAALERGGLRLRRRSPLAVGARAVLEVLGTGAGGRAA